MMETISGGDPMSQHTPGPWRQKYHSSSGDYAIDGDYQAIATVFEGLGKTHGVGIHNARLIAKAPDMLALLQRFNNGGNTVNASFWWQFQRDASALLKEIEGCPLIPVVNLPEGCSLSPRFLGVKRIVLTIQVGGVGEG